jgi:hypothetical protein
MLGLFLFMHEKDWFIVWAIFFGWIFIGGVRTLARGIGAVVEANTVLRGLKVLEGQDRPAIAKGPDTQEIIAPASVTEGTTTLLETPLERK